MANATESEIAAAITRIVAAEGYPCVGARSVFKRRTASIVVLDELAESGCTVELLHDLERFSHDHPKPDVVDSLPEMASFVAAFRSPATTSEVEFEDALWRQLTMIHAIDTVPWDDAVVSDPADPHFGFSVAGRAFFVIGMHPGASRLARRFPLPMMVFNLHSQFDQLRAAGKYDRLRDTVRRRDLDLQGSANPMLADHGARSEARQYSGRAVPHDWRPPYDLGATRGDAT